jgi:3-hydroxybutyryl-CoA dehydrogenase
MIILEYQPSSLVRPGSDPILMKAVRLIASNLRTLADYGLVSAEEIPCIMDRIRTTADLDTATRDGVDFALEAVPEIPDVKREIFGRLDTLCPKDTVLASNTSTLDVFSIAEIRNPARMVIAHWFAPPHIIPLVEVVPGPRTAPATVASTAGLMERLGKRPVVLKQFIPAFIVNRIQLGISNAVMEMLEQGWASPEEIDLAVKTSLGIRLPVVGVVQTLDFAGLKLVYDIQKAEGNITPIIAEKVEKGHLGVSTSKGLYDYDGRTEEEILRKRDGLYLKVLQHLESMKAFDPI